MTAGFSLSHLQCPNNNFQSSVHSKTDLGSIILYTITGPTKCTDTFLDEVVS